jgi:hypothetical protein
LFVRGVRFYFRLALVFFDGRGNGRVELAVQQVFGQFATQYGDVFRGFDADADGLTFDLQDRDRDVGANLNLLFRFAGKHQHEKHSFVRYREVMLSDVTVPEQLSKVGCTVQD